MWTKKGPVSLDMQIFTYTQATVPIFAPNLFVYIRKTPVLPGLPHVNYFFMFVTYSYMQIWLIVL